MVNKSIVNYLFLFICFFNILPKQLPAFAQTLDANYELGATYYEKQMYSEAIDYFRKVIQKNPNYADAYYYLGLSLYAIADYDGAIEVFMQALKLYTPPPLDLTYRIALTYMELGQIDEALVEFRKLTSQNIDKEIADNAQDWIDTIEGDQMKDTASQIEANNPYFKSGLDLYNQQNYKESEEAFIKALKNYHDKTGSALVYYYLGTVCYNQNKYKESLDYFKQVIILMDNTQIARDAKNYMDNINELNIIKPFNASVFLGPRFDSNINYSYGKDAVPDISTLLTLMGSYRPNEFLEGKFIYFLDWNSGLVSNLYNKSNISSDYNFQALSSSVTYSYPLSNLLQLEAEGTANWWILGDKTYMLSGKLSPRISIFESPRLITTLQGDMELNTYPSNSERDNIGATGGIYQYIYLWNRQSWLKMGYEYQTIFANDDLKIFSQDLDTSIRYRYANSYAAHNLSMTIGIPLFFNSRIQMVSKLGLLDYTNPDIFQRYERNPENNMDMELKQDVKKYRQDSLFLLGLEYFIPINPTLTLSAYYNYTKNISNISKLDYYVDRSYDKNLIGINLIANF